MLLPATGVIGLTGIRTFDDTNGNAMGGKTATTTEQYAAHMLPGILASPPAQPLQSSGIDPLVFIAAIEAAVASISAAAAY